MVKANKQRYDLVLSASLWDRLYQHLIRVSIDNPDPPEEFAYLFASLNMSPLGLRFIVHDMLPAVPDDFNERSSQRFRLKRSFVAKALQRCHQEGWSLIGVHSHPSDLSFHTTFSKIDTDYNDRSLPPYSFLLGENFRLASMVVGQNSLDVHFFDPAAKKIIPLQRVTIVGRSDKTKSALSHIPTTSSPKLDPASSRLRDHRQELFFGKEVQRRLADMTIAIVGMGGLGSFVALELAHIGVRHLVLLDFDAIEETNLNRLIGVGPSQVGEKKVAVFAEVLKHIDPDIQVEPITLSLLTEQGVNAVKGADILIGCVDNHGTRLILNQIATRYLIPLVDGGSGVSYRDPIKNELQVGGQVQIVLPDTRCLLCSKTINLDRASAQLKSQSDQAFDRERGYNMGEVAPSVVSLNGVIASLQVTEILQLLAEDITGGKKPSRTRYDALKGELTPVLLRASLESCPECGTEGMIGYGDLAPIRFATDTPSLSVAEIKNEAIE